MFQGSLVALVTPMHNDGSIDYASFEKLIDWHIAQKTSAIVVLGTTGESPTIENHERRELIKTAVFRARKKIPVIVGTGSNSTAHTITLTQEAMSLGADAVMLVTPYYNKPTQEGLFQHYAAVARAVAIPQILYNVPSRTGCNLLPETVIRLMVFSNIVGVKDSHPAHLKAIRAASSGFLYFSADDSCTMELMLAGANGVISVAANVIPDKMTALCRALSEKDIAMAQKINDSMTDFFAGLFVQSNPIPVKWMMVKMGLISSGIRLPLTSLDATFHHQTEALLHKVTGK